MAEVGKLESPKIQGKYETGQLFLHRVFGYRGVILFPWLARVYDRDLPNQSKINETPKVVETPTPTTTTTATTNGNGATNNVGKEVKGRTHTFYQVLIDSRDCPYIVSIICHPLSEFSKKNHKFFFPACSNRSGDIPW